MGLYFFGVLLSKAGKCDFGETCLETHPETSPDFCLSTWGERPRNTARNIPVKHTPATNKNTTPTYRYHGRHPSLLMSSMLNAFVNIFLTFAQVGMWPQQQHRPPNSFNWYSWNWQYKVAQQCDFWNPFQQLHKRVMACLEAFLDLALPTRPHRSRHCKIHMQIDVQTIYQPPKKYITSTHIHALWTCFHFHVRDGEDSKVCRRVIRDDEGTAWTVPPRPLSIHSLGGRVVGTYDLEVSESGIARGASQRKQLVILDGRPWTMAELALRTTFSCSGSDFRA